MSFLKIGLRIWIALTSVFSFLVGWIMLAHAPKPAQPTSSSSSSSGVSVVPLPTLAPMTPLHFSDDDNGGFQSQSFSVQPAPQPQMQTQNFYAPPPSFGTGGS
jgi:hypothetical protein